MYAKATGWKAATWRVGLSTYREVVLVEHHHVRAGAVLRVVHA